MSIDEGVYTIKSAKATTSFLTMDKSLARQPAYVFGYPWSGLDTQKWLFKKRHDSPTYTIQNLGTEKYLAIDGGAWNDRSVVGKVSGVNWYIAPGIGNHMRLYVQNTSFNLDLTGYGDPTPGTRVAIWGDNMKHLDHCWILEPVRTAPQPSILQSALIRSGKYLLVNVYSNKVLDLIGSSAKTVITSPLNGGTNQQWRIERLGGGYSICSVSSGKYLTFEEHIGDGSPVVANEFPVSWNVSSAPDSSDIYICWPTRQVAVGLIMPPSPGMSNSVQLQTFVEENEWQRWKLVELEQRPSVPTAPAFESPVPQPMIPGNHELAAEHNSTDEDPRGLTTETATVSVTEDEHSIKTTRTTVTTVTMVEPK